MVPYKRYDLLAMIRQLGTPTWFLHVYRLNTDVDSRNALMLDNLAPRSAQYTIKAIASIAGQTSHISLSTLSDKMSETGGLLITLKLAVGARVMLTVNVDVSDGLVNGARGEEVKWSILLPTMITKLPQYLSSLTTTELVLKQFNPVHIVLPSLILCL